MIGELIDHYRVLELVGRGAMGIVYKALDLNLERQVAIKVMSAEARSDPEFVERFRQEARMQGALNHPNVALLFDYFVHDGAPVAVMEFIDGESLEQLIRRRGAIPAHESMPLFKQALRGVAAAHRAGIIHRDLKPSNLMITRDDIVKVMDFGIAKRQGAPGTTKVSTSIGSPLYMAPEQILGRPVDCRTDVYALGITLYELISGQRPFNPRGKAEYLVLNAHVNDLPEPPTTHCRTIPQPIADAVMRSLAKDPDARFQSVDDFMRALPDVPAPSAAAPRVAPSGTVALPRVGPTGTTAIPRAAPSGTASLARVGPTGTVAIPRAAPSGTVALEYSPSMSEESVTACEPSGIIVFEFGPSARRDAEDSTAFDSSAEMVWPECPPRCAPSPADAASPAVAAKVAPAGTPVTVRLNHNSTPSSAASSPGAPGLLGALPGFMQRLRAGRRIIAAGLVATLVLGALGHHAKRLRATPRGPSPASTGSGFTYAQASTETHMPTSTEPSAPPAAAPRPTVEAAAAPSAEVSATTAPPPAPPMLATKAAPLRQDLSGTWRGEYVDASGRSLLRVVNLSINRVQDDGGIEGTLQYEAASGDGECKLHPRGSTYSAGQQRLHLSPEGCSPRYPRELGVPLDFDGVSPRANTLKDGRIQAPTGEMIRVKLKRVSGV
jgi:predicted Ser/Thr protein kinase